MINNCVENCLTLFITNDKQTTFRVIHQVTLVQQQMLNEKEKKKEKRKKEIVFMSV